MERMTNRGASVLIFMTLDVETGIAEVEYMVSQAIVDTVNNLSATNTYEAHFTQQFYRQ